jgi:hypothetical protein
MDDLVIDFANTESEKGSVASMSEVSEEEVK